MRFMKKLFSNALTGGNQGFLEENIDSLINNKEDIKSDRLRTKIKIIKRYRRDKNNADNKSQDISNLNKTNNKEENKLETVEVGVTFPDYDQVNEASKRIKALKKN